MQTTLVVSSVHAVLVTLETELTTALVRPLGGFMYYCTDSTDSFSIYSISDIDECALETYSCDVNADCENTIGSYDCICVDGYVKNGTFCMSEYYTLST